MKKLSAFLLVIAVLNPLCCCLSSAEASQQSIPAQEHACCPGDSEQNQTDQQDPANCPHKILTDKDALIATDNSSHTASGVVQADQISEAIRVDSLYARQSIASIRLLATAQIQAWIRTQTDCVRLL